MHTVTIRICRRDVGQRGNARGRPLLGLSCFVFVLSCFIGYMVIWNVTASLHTPLMSVTNAVSSIIIIGAITQISTTDTISLILASVAIFIASINIFGGFAVTKRMLGMFKK